MSLGPDMEENDKGIVHDKMINSPSNSMRAVLVFLDGDGR